MRHRALRAIKVIHTLIWAAFASAIVAIPLAIIAGRQRLGVVLVGLVSVECLVLAWNHMRCPLTDWAARYTDDRRPNFDIYLPEWLARYNKWIFGGLFAGGVAFTAIRWILR